MASWKAPSVGAAVAIMMLQQQLKGFCCSRSGQSFFCCNTHRLGLKLPDSGHFAQKNQVRVSCEFFLQKRGSRVGGLAASSVAETR